MTVDITRRQTLGVETLTDSPRWRRRNRARTGRDQVPTLEFLESRRLLSGAGSLGIAAQAGPDGNVWFSMNSNNIGTINPSNPGAGVTQYAIPTGGSGVGPIAAGPEEILYASSLTKSQIYKIDKTTGKLLDTIPVAENADSLIFDNNNEIIYSAYSVGGVGQIRRINPTVGISSDTLLATVGIKAADLALVPGGNFVLATSQATGKIYKVDLNDPGQAPVTFGNGQYYGGIVFDSSGRLFAVAGSKIVELDPTTFSVIASSGTLSGLDGMAFDPVTGDLIAGSRAVNATSGRKGFYELSLQAGSFLHATLISNSSFPTTFDPDGLESDGEGNLYFASDKIYKYVIATGATGQLTPVGNVLPGLDDLLPLTGNGGHSAPDYWFFEQATNAFAYIDPTNGNITVLPPLTTPNAQVNGITAGPDGTVWFTESNADKIGMINVDTHQITEFPLTTPNAQPYGIVEGPDGNMWFTEAGANQIGKITPAGSVQEFPIDFTGQAKPEGIVVGSNSNLWFMLPGIGKIGEMNTFGTMIYENLVPNPNTSFSQIVSNSTDGNLWFTEGSADKVVRLNPTTHVFTQVAMPTAGAFPDSITVDRNGNVWIIESNASKIAEIPSGSLIPIEYAVAGLTPVTPIISWANPLDIVYGTALDSTQLDATAYYMVGGNQVAVHGSGSYSPLPGTVLQAGAGQSLSVTFTPEDTTDYTTAFATVSINVNPAQTTLTPDHLAFTYNGAPHPVTFTTTPADLTGVSVTYTQNGIALVSAPTLPGSYAVTATLSNHNYTALPFTRPFVINPAPAQSTSFSNISGSAIYGSTATLVATLSPSGSTVAGELVVFTLDVGGNPTQVGTAVTDGNGIATWSGVSLQGLNADFYPGAVRVSFAGDSNYMSANAFGDLTVSKAQASLILSGLKYTFDGVAYTASFTTTPAGLTGVTVSYTQNGIAVAAPTLPGSYTVTATLNSPNYLPASRTDILIISPRADLAPQIDNPVPVFQPKHNKRNKPIGKAVLTGFKFHFTAALNPSSAMNIANYELDTVTVKRVKRTSKQILHPVRVLSASITPAGDSVTLTFAGKQKFPTGGQITVVNTLPGGITGTSGTPLTGHTLFTISKGGRRITPL